MVCTPQLSTRDLDMTYVCVGPFSVSFDMRYYSHLSATGLMVESRCNTVHSRHPTRVSLIDPDTYLDTKQAAFRWISSVYGDRLAWLYLHAAERCRALLREVSTQVCVTV
jgi:hypothetical protein